MKKEQAGKLKSGGHPCSTSQITPAHRLDSQDCNFPGKTVADAVSRELSLDTTSHLNESALYLDKTVPTLADCILGDVSKERLVCLVTGIEG